MVTAAGELISGISLTENSSPSSFRLAQLQIVQGDVGASSSAWRGLESGRQRAHRVVAQPLGQCCL